MMQAAIRANPMAFQPPAHSSVDFDAGLISRLSKSGPRYTSYPTAYRFS
jgi:oxygen-independent coproporphyrinogen-3 oxidase